MSESYWPHTKLAGNKKDEELIKEVVPALCQLLQLPSPGPNGAKTQHSFPAHAAVQGCTPAHCYTLGNTDTELIPVARQCRSTAVASAALAICHAQDWLCFFDCRRREMLVQRLAQGHGGDRSSGSHGPWSKSALFGSKSLLLALARGCVLCPKQGNVSEPEQRLIPLYQFPQSNTSARRQTGFQECRAWPRSGQAAGKKLAVKATEVNPTHRVSWATNEGFFSHGCHFAP